MYFTDMTYYCNGSYLMQCNVMVFEKKDVIVFSC